VKFLIFDGFSLPRSWIWFWGEFFGFDYDMFIVSLTIFEMLLAIFALFDFEIFGLLLRVSFSYKALFFL
jgi:hypothetical protein